MEGSTTGNEMLEPRNNTSRRVMAFLEVCLIATLGDLLVVPLILQVLGLPVSRVFEESWLLFILLTAKATILLLAIPLLLWLHGESLSTLNWGKGQVREDVSRGILFVPLLFGVVALIGLLFHFFLPEYVTEENPMLNMLREPLDVALFLITSLYVGGFQEEVQRAFVLTRFRQHLGGAWVGLIVWSAYFGIGHSIQGIDNAVKAGFLGALFGILYLRRGMRSPIVAHALYDTVTVIAFWFFMRQ